VFLLLVFPDGVYGCLFVVVALVVVVGVGWCLSLLFAAGVVLRDVLLVTLLLFFVALVLCFCFSLLVGWW